MVLMASYGNCTVRCQLRQILKTRTVVVTLYRCPKSLEPMGILIIFLIFIYRLKVKIKNLKIALTSDERVEIVLLSGLMPDILNVEQSPHKHGKADEKMRRVSG
jgi:hypothetical protein